MYVCIAYYVTPILCFMHITKAANEAESMIRSMISKTVIKAAPTNTPRAPPRFDHAAYNYT